MNAAQTQRFHIACSVLTGVTLLNFVIFVVVALHLGGDAVNGKVEGGHYYLFGLQPESRHKGYTEVSEAVFNYSRWHVYSIFVTWPLMMAAGLTQNRITKRPTRNRPTTL
jgi:hypothetical protein